MIGSLRITSGFASELPSLKDRTLTFKPGLNVLFGPNGCGKTAALKVIAGHAGIPTDLDMAFGWDGLYINHGFGRYDLAAQLKEHTAGKCTADLAYDGAGVYYPRLEKAERGYFDYNTPGEVERLMTEMQGHLSSGNTTLMRFDQALTELLKKGPPKVRGFWHSCKWRAPYGPGSAWQEQEKDALAAYEKSLVKLEKPQRTALLDEPERSVSLAMNATIWRGLPKLVADEDVQIIVASHSPWCLFADNAHIIEMVPGCVAEAVDALTMLAGRITAGVRPTCDAFPVPKAPKAKAPKGKAKVKK